MKNKTMLMEMKWNFHFPLLLDNKVLIFKQSTEYIVGEWNVRGHIYRAQAEGISISQCVINKIHTT